MKFLKFLIALALLPLLFAECWILCDLIRASIPGSAWTSSWFLSFMAGFCTWFMIFFFMPRPMWFYVLGHELTHAWAAMISGGKILQFRVTSRGGHIATNRVNWWIALSPYFVPLYALIWGALWITVDCYYSLKEWQSVLYFGLGLFWSFHLSFTVAMLHPEQTDLSGEGYFFSGVVILIMNLICVLLLFIPLTHDLTWKEILQLIQNHLLNAYLVTWHSIRHLFWIIWHKWRQLNYGEN